MSNTLKQINAVVAMNLKSLPHRFWMSMATLVAIAIVVAVLLAFLAMADGFIKTIESTGSQSVAVVLRDGAQSELNSFISRDQLKLVNQAPGVKSKNGVALVSGEVFTVVDGKKRDSDTTLNLPFRGLTEQGVQLRDKVTITSGRLFIPGTNEIVVGAGVLRQFEGFELGNEVTLAKNTWTVVGIFEADGSIFESEIWTDTKVIQSVFNRGSSVQVLRVALETEGDITALDEYMESDVRLKLDVKTEKDYYSSQSEDTSDFIFKLGWPLAIIMAFGALAGALNTMYNSVAQRTVEIATLRAIGFRNLPAFVGTLVEALVLSLAGGVVGITLAYLFFDGLSASTLGASFSQVVFSFEVTSKSFVQGMVLALIIGLIGGLFPAWRAARMPVIKAFSIR